MLVQSWQRLLGCLQALSLVLLLYVWNLCSALHDACTACTKEQLAHPNLTKRMLEQCQGADEICNMSDWAPERPTLLAGRAHPGGGGPLEGLKPAPQQAFVCSGAGRGLTGTSAPSGLCTELASCSCNPAVLLRRACTADGSQLQSLPFECTGGSYQPRDALQEQRREEMGVC